MKIAALSVFGLLLVTVLPALGQKPLMEGTVAYKVKLTTPDHHLFDGIFTFTIKDGKIRKELKLDNGYHYTLLVNTTNNTVYSLINRMGKNYAIQLTMSELQETHKKYSDFNLAEDRKQGKIIAGYTAFKGDVTYTDGSKCDIYYTPDWYADVSVSYDRFPGAKFIPLSYTYKDENGSSMLFEADKVSASPVENSIFKVPSEYKIISNAEYKQLKR